MAIIDTQTRKTKTAFLIFSSGASPGEAHRFASFWNKRCWGLRGVDGDISVRPISLLVELMGGMFENIKPGTAGWKARLSQVQEGSQRHAGRAAQRDWG